MSAFQSLAFFSSEIILLTGAFAVLFAGFFTSCPKKLGLLALAMVAASALTAEPPEIPQMLFADFFSLDHFTALFRWVALGVIGFTILGSLRYEKFPARSHGEYYSLLLFLGFGLILMASSTNLLMIFLAIEFVSLISYLLAGFLKNDARSKEAGLKYFLFGSVASAIMLYGMSLLFGLTGTLDLEAIYGKISMSYSLVSMLSLLMILAGIGFKISMAPFHMWAPDVYEGAPTPVTALLAAGPKALGFAVMIRVLATAFGLYFSHWTNVLFLTSVLTMTLGNIVAISQTNIKRLLAYSSIAQAGYILIGITVFSIMGLSSVLFYLIAYIFTNLGAFLVVITASRHLGSDEISSYAGLARRSPFLAASMTLFLLSLAGIPPLAGFVGKFLVFAGAIEAGYIGLAVVAVINSAVAAFYYFKIIRTMYLAPTLSTEGIPQPFSLRFAICLALAGTVLIGLLPAPLIGAIGEIF